MKAAILCVNFLDHDGNHPLIGGVETYVLNLALICQEIGLETTIYQFANLQFEKEQAGLKVKGIHINNLPWKKRKTALYSAVEKEINMEKDIVIFGSDHISVPTGNRRHISVQHGINWDLPVRYLSNHRFARYKWAASFIKWREISFYKQSFENCMNTVCVDYNFMNWYRTTIAEENSEHNVWVIPNFSAILPVDHFRTRSYSNKDIRILFARRMVEYRGTRIMSAAAKYLLSKYPDIRFTFAGEGPDEDWLRRVFSSEKGVNIIKYLPEEAQAIHLRHDIAVIPSLASEGTSIAVVEAMATGCPVVATAVGGLTNQIIHGFNGLLVMPNISSLIDGLEVLIRNPEMRRSIGTRAYETAKEAFPLARWKRAWQEVISRVGQIPLDSSY
jgi:glycosyltransferase involved in cell wall biosynthesis